MLTVLIVLIVTMISPLLLERLERSVVPPRVGAEAGLSSPRVVSND